MLSCFSHVWLFAIPWTVAHQALRSMEFSKQDYQSGLSFPSPGDLPNTGIEPASCALAGRFFTTSTTGEALSYSHVANFELISGPSILFSVVPRGRPVASLQTVVCTANRTDPFLPILLSLTSHQTALNQGTQIFLFTLSSLSPLWMSFSFPFTHFLTATWTKLRL